MWLLRYLGYNVYTFGLRMHKAVDSAELSSNIHEKGELNFLEFEKRRGQPCFYSFRTEAKTKKCCPHSLF